MTTRELNKLKKQIETAYPAYMHGVQVNIFNLSKVTDTVLKAILAGETIEQGYAKAKELYQENK